MNYYTENDLEKLKILISQGNSLLFIGAGFSTFATNLLNEPMPTGRELADKIAKKNNFEADGDLFYAVEKFLEKSSKNELISFLEEIFKTKKFDPILKEILKFNFRRIYTTNYDDVIEQVSNCLSINRKSIDAETSPENYFKFLNICVHINGYIKNLNENNFDKSFKLSENSYLEPDSFERSKWWYSFKKDLEASNAIIFVGYSLYDIEIKKLLYNNPFKEKTYFITKTDLKEKEAFKYKKYGKIINIGIKDFSKILKSVAPNKSKNDLQVFKKYEIDINSNIEIKDKDIDYLFTRGLLDKNKLIESLNNPNKYYVVKRNIVEKVIEKINEYNFVFIYSEFGNGKSIFMEELKYYIYKNGYNVFELIDYELDFKNDIELINNLQNQSIIFIDRYCDNVDLLNYLKIYNSEKIKVILSDRTSNHNHFIENNFNDLKFYEFNLDMLTEREIEKIIEILFHIGIWGKYSNNKRVIKNKIIQEYYKQFSLLLLDIFESEQIKKEIESLVKPFIKEKNLKETFFAILLLNLIDVEITKSLVEEVSGNDVIMNISFNELFGKDFKINSSLLSKFIISNYFTYSFIKEILLKIVEKAQDYKKYDVFWQKIERELLRFHFIEQIIPKEHKKIFLKQYFEKLKSKDKLQWLKNEPHYWLQYAMAEMANKNLQSAQQKLDTAYALKSSKYDFSYIDNQQARLYLLFALQENNGKKIFDYFQKANSLLTTKLDRYSVKHIATYKNLYKEKFRLFAKNDKRQFLDIVRNIYNDILKIKQDASDLYIMCNEYSKCENALRYILDKERLL